MIGNSSVYRILILLGFVIWAGMGCEKKAEQAPKEAQQKQAQQQDVIQVETMVVEPQYVEPAPTLLGRVAPFSVAQVRPQITGIIQQLFFQQGGFVEKGQQLYQIDAAPFEAAVQRAKAALADSEAQLKVASTSEKRLKNLLATQAVSRQEYDEAEAQKSSAAARVQLANAELQTAQVNLDYTKMYAPISGYIGPSSVTQGALVTAQQPQALATIRTLDPVYVDLSQAVSEIEQFHDTLFNNSEIGSLPFTVSLFVGEKNKEYMEKGSLYATDFAVDPSTGVVQLRALFPNPNNRLLPGMFVKAKIQDDRREKLILLPQKAVSITNTGEKRVWVVDENSVAQSRRVTTGGTVKNQWIIENGLTEGDTVITDGIMTLQPGAKVEAQTKTQSKPSV